MEIKDLTVIQRTIPERKGSYCELPENMNGKIIEYLRSEGIEALYSHQGEMFEQAMQGKHLVITTSTASGKTLSFLLPVLQHILEDPLSRAIFVYPTKALANDQFRVIKRVLSFFKKEGISAGVYDGDTNPTERTRIRKEANLILTNPEMLNGAFLPNHSKYGFDSLFSNLSFVVIDEVHTYRGAFGAHMANICRRLRRICRYYHTSPQFLCSSATIANPSELCEKICGETFTLIDRDGSPASKKNYCIIQPPAIQGSNDQIYGRRSASYVASELIPELVHAHTQFIAFAKSRRSVEIILKEAKDKLDGEGFLGESSANKIAGYRGGYTPLERKNIEKRMMDGDLYGLVSTNALELGIDIGTLDSTVLVGYPGTKAAFWQQSGRAGRGKQEATNFLILENLPIDQYIAIDPNWLFESKSEFAIVDPDNLMIQLAHVRSAAAEMPLTLDDIAAFHDLGEILPVLLQAGEVKNISGRFVWTGPAFPAGDYSLRNMDQTRFKLMDIERGISITEMDETQAYHEIYPGAIYMHDGVHYEVSKLDLVNRTGEAKRFEGNYYTVPAGTKEVRILGTVKEEAWKRTTIRFGDINVNDIVFMFKKLQFHNHQNLGYVSLTVPLQKEYNTESAWISLPEDVVRVYRSLLIPQETSGFFRNNHFDGLSHILKTAALMTTMTSDTDIDVLVSNNATIPDEGMDEVVSLFFYDRYEGGLGYSEKISEQIPVILDRAIRLVTECTCTDGCPVCVGDYTLDRKMILWGLQSILKEQNAPQSNKQVSEPKIPTIRKEFSFFDLPIQWSRFCETVVKNGESGSAFLRSIKNVQLHGHRLCLFVENSFVAKWMMEKENYRTIENMLRFHCTCPGDMVLDVMVQRSADSDIADREKKIRRRFGRLTGLDPEE